MIAKKTDLVCWVCRKPIKGARTVIDEKWYCGDCTYLHDHPHAERPARIVRHRAPKQEETLFPLPPKRHADNG